ncbi:YggS family pyridoxal phosphate-dependent enzyme [Pseudochrobactrum sp. MP213Fo]|uniref:YggS family pyridoxal phosphate-dependent enzyme n=1 Tax=Pseudochrobactrum sp. MP213Fo TaxID=3022250 RepID=UPI003B9E557D
MNSPENASKTATEASIAENLKTIRQSLALGLSEAKRDAGSVTLVAVSKTFSAEEILPALHEGQRIFGENRVQEAQSKWPLLREKFADIELHLIGPLQSNKTAEAVALFDVIQTVDREKIAATIATEMQRLGRKLKLFVQVNTGDEEQKAGIAPSEAVAFVNRCRDVHGLDIAGLMCIPPFNENPGPHFALLRKLAKDAGVQELSMGMSGDFDTAIQFGATYVRVGSAIFGSRPPLVSA